MISNCIFNNNAAKYSGAVEFYNTGTIGDEKVIINNCLFTNNIAYYNSALVSNYDIEINNCTFVDNISQRYPNICFYGNEADVLIRNCIIWNYIDSSSIEIRPFSNNVLIENSNVHNCNGSGGSWNSIYGTDGGGNIDQDPLFVSSVNSNYELMSNSPCVNQGSSYTSIPKDLAGNARVAHGSIDMGAYEWQVQYLGVNNTDEDKDLIPNYADGIDKYRNYGIGAGGQFLRVQAYLPDDIDMDVAYIKFIYSESDPDQLVKLAGNEYIYTLPDGKMRLWNVNGDISRKIAPADIGGDYIKSNVGYSVSDMNVDNGGNCLTFYVEAVKQSTVPDYDLITVEIDPDGDGATGWESFLNYELCILKVDIDGDGNHDGNVNDNDEDDNIAAENNQWGIITLCNVDNDDYLAPGEDVIDSNTIPLGKDCLDANIDGEDDLSDMAKVILRKIPLVSYSVPDDWHIRLRLSNPENVKEGTQASDIVRVFSERSIDAEAILGLDASTNTGFDDSEFEIGGVGSSCISLNDINGQDKELAVEGLGPHFAGELTMIAELVDPISDSEERVIHYDEIKIKVAPLILLHHLDEVAESYVSMNSSAESGQYCLIEFPDATPESVIDNIIESTDRWAQDQFQICYQKAPYHSMHVILDSVRDRDLKNFPVTNYPSGFLGVDKGHIQIQIEEGYSHHSTYNSFGNLEVSPPCTVSGISYPYGRIYYGSLIYDNLKSFLTRQGIQSPVEFDTDWLSVGHVDEFMTIIPDLSGTHGWKVLMASPELALDILHDDINGQDVPKLISLVEDVDGDGIQDYESCVSSFLNKSTNGVTLKVYNEQISSSYLTGENGLYNAVAEIFNLDIENDIIFAPVLFEFYRGGALAATPGLVNGMVFKGISIDTYIAPDPFFCYFTGSVDEDVNCNFILDQGEDLNGNGLLETQRDIILETFEADLPGTIDVVAIDDWYYHKKSGEVHCGGNTKRVIPTNINWWSEIQN